MSLVIEMENGTTVEVGTIGNEGMVGTPVFLGVERSPTKAFCQVPGDCLRMPASGLQERARGRGPHPPSARQQVRTGHDQPHLAIRRVQSPPLVEERTCRWLLMMHDRVGKNDFLLTQEFIAQMLGVRQSSVTVATGLLERAGLITYKRGRITVLDRERLEQASCECYNVVRLEYDRLLEKNSRTS